MKVCYDKEKDIVSMYFEENFNKEENKNEFLETKEKNLNSSKVYDSEKAANLILDTVDIISDGYAIGFRVFNASKYYDKELLDVADQEILDDKDILKPSEKVIATVTKEGVLN